jgi:oligoendopeptidase F
VTEPIQPDWDMRAYFDSFDGAAYRSFRRALEADVAGLQQESAELADVSPESLSAWVSLLERVEAVTSRSGHLAGYLGCLGAADARSEEIQRETAAAAAARAEYEKLFVTLRAALAACNADTFERLLAAPELAGAEYFLSRLRDSAQRKMEPALEGLQADLAVTGIQAWGRLYDQISGRLEFDLKRPGRSPERIPVAVTRSLLEDPDAAVRQAALRGSNAAWESVADVLASCLNAIAGTRLALYRRRGITDFLEPALFDAAISARCLDSLLETVEQRAEVARDYLRRKAHLLGREKLGFQDLLAPLPLKSHARIPWPEARERVCETFGRFYPALGEFAATALERRWVDWSPRAGKRPGGFCSTSSWINESRIFMTFNETLGDLSTLAHELGHAFHGSLMADMRPWSRRYPMTLAETASTFAEQLVLDAVLDDPDAPAEQRTLILDSRMQDASTFLLNIPMRFYFEESLYEERKRGEISVSRMQELMLAAQRRCYGDALADDELDPWFWASKLHFYITGVSFYNFPYTFGYLFSMGIFSLAKQAGPDFLPRYEQLLRRTGSDTAEGVAREALGVELEQPDFWNASLDLIDSDFQRWQESLRGLPGDSSET